MNYLVDVNVWLALALIGHVHQVAALKWIEEPAVGLTYFCRVTQQGLLRLLTNPKVMGANVLTAGDVWRLYDTFYQDSRVRFAEEPPGLEDFWREQSRSAQTGQQRPAQMRVPGHHRPAFLGLEVSLRVRSTTELGSHNYGGGHNQPDGCDRPYHLTMLVHQLFTWAGCDAEYIYGAYVLSILCCSS